jgi:glycopeptide antibiotics resistance protein
VGRAAVTPPRARAWPTYRTFAVGLTASALFALYGSLVPFEIRRVTFDQALRLYETLWSQPLVILSRTDFIANVLLTGPLGFCLMALLRLDRRGIVGSAVAAALTVITGAAFALGLEFLQVFTMDRVPSISDVTAQTLGTIIGAIVWIGIGQGLVDRLRGGVRGRLSEAQRSLQALLIVYAGVWWLSMLLPLELSLSPIEVVRKYRAGLVLLVPFSAPFDSFADGLWDSISSLAAAVPLGVLALLTVTNHGWRPRRRLAVALGVALVAAAEVSQLFVAGRVVDVTDVLLGGCGAAVGVWLAASRVRVAEPVARSKPRPQPARSPIPALLGVFGWSGVLGFYHWKPFDFTFDGMLVRDRLSQVSLMPLRGYEFGTGIDVLAQALVKAGLAFPLGFFLGSWLARWWREESYGATLRLIAGLVIAAGVLGTIEVGQVFLPGRVPDVTDVLIGCLGAAGGLKAAAFVPAALDPLADAAK